ncbi:MAG: carboxypeptidase regulatory-like domain-containing protein [Blastocatellia bacterium]
MKKAINVLIAGCLLGAIAVTPDSFNNSASGGFVIEAAPTLAFITGTVKDERGKPLFGAIVAVLEPRPRGKEIKSVKTDTLGKFSAGVTPGTYLLRAAAEGFRPQLSTRLTIDRPAKTSYNFALKSDDTLVQKRGDSDDYRWIARGVPRHPMNLQKVGEEEAVEETTDTVAQTGFLAKQASFHGMVQFITATSSAGNPAGGLPAPDFFGTNFAVSGSLGGNFEMAFIGQLGAGQLAPGRIAAVATFAPSDNHQVTATIGYGQVGVIRKWRQGINAFGAEPIFSRPRLRAITPGAATPMPDSSKETSLEQLSVSATDSWQVFRPLLVIYGFDYSRFMGAVNERDSVLPRFAVQYTPSARWRVNAAVTPGTDQRLNSPENFNSENIQAAFEASPAEIAYADAPVPDRSQRFEVGIERVLDEGNTSIEASVFYDLISGHGVGVLALPLEASFETQATFQQVAHQVAAMNGASRGVRLMLNRRFNDHVTASAGYSFGRGSKFNDAPIDSITPAELFRGGFFHVATAKLDFDFAEQTGTRISTVIRLSPSAVVFAIDPFAGRMSVYDPNINIYVTQELPNFGLPVRWEALVDARNLLDKTPSVEDGGLQIVTARMRRTVRGGLAFRW